MNLAYIGFSKILETAHIGASNAGIAQSNYTYKLLSEVAHTDYYVCQSSFKKFVTDRDDVFLLRSNKIKMVADSFLFFIKLTLNKNYTNIIIYHSLLFSPLIFLLAVFRCKYTLQVNEVYSMSGTHNSAGYGFVENFIFKITSNYIVSTVNLESFLYRKRKGKLTVLAVIPGPVLTQSSCNNSNDASLELKKDNKNQRLVYAGVVDKIKNGGAFISVDLARKLNDSNFSIDIYGFGTEEDIFSLVDAIKKNNLESATIVRYMGNVDPENLVKFLKDYDVGLVTQYIGTSFSETSFPSKILTYLSAGLYTICATSAVIERWEYKKYLYVYRDTELNDLVSWLKNGKYEICRKCNIKVSSKIHNDIVQNLRLTLL